MYKVRNKLQTRICGIVGCSIVGLCLVFHGSWRECSLSTSVGCACLTCDSRTEGDAMVDGVRTDDIESSLSLSLQCTECDTFADRWSLVIGDNRCWSWCLGRGQSAMMESW